MIDVLWVGGGGRGVRLPPHPALTAHTAFVVLELARDVRTAVDAALADSGLDWPSFLVMSIVAAVEAPSQEAVCDRTGLDRGSVSRMCVDLEYDGFLERKRGHVDGRKVLCLPTETGRAAVQEGGAAVEEATRKTLAALRADERRRLGVLLRRALGARPA